VIDVKQVRNIPLFAVLSEGALQKLASRATTKFYQPHEMILCQGQEAETVFLLIAGCVRVFHRNQEGSEVLLKLFQAPALFGEMETIAGIHFLENAAAVDPSTLVHIPKSLFLEMLAEEMGLAKQLACDLAMRLCIACDNQRRLAFQNVRTRLASLLVHLARRGGERVATGIRINQVLTQDDMANAIGVTNRAVRKEVSHWLKRGVLKRVGNHYIVQDITALEKLLEEGDLGVIYSLPSTTDAT
jgi:CRP/FNR family transcriptional regulator, cyclic AMP receptor protein